MQANFAVNVGGRALHPGDAVTVQAVLAAGFDAAHFMWQVRAAPAESAIAPGARVTAAADGAVRPLATRTVDGMVVSEGAPVPGIALEPAESGLVWVLVNPQYARVQARCETPRSVVACCEA